MQLWKLKDHAELPVEKCLDCDGAGKYPAGHTCRSCGGLGHVPIGSNTVLKCIRRNTHG